jgi:hypothetical protein
LRYFEVEVVEAQQSDVEAQAEGEEGSDAQVHIEASLHHSLTHSLTYFLTYLLTYSLTYSLRTLTHHTVHSTDTTTPFHYTVLSLHREQIVNNPSAARSKQASK